LHIGVDFIDRKNIHYFFLFEQTSNKLYKIGEGMKTQSIATKFNANDAKLIPSLAIKGRKIEQAVVVHYLPRWMILWRN